MEIDLKTQIHKGDITVVVIPNSVYTKRIVDLIKYFHNNYSATCYVNLNKITKNLLETMKTEKIDSKKFLFVDGITKSVVQNPTDIENCFYISSSQALTEMSIVINKVLSFHKYDGMIFDSISTLLIYNKSDVVSKFIHHLINKIRASNTTTIFTALEADTSSDIMKEIGMFVDNVIEYK